MVRMVRAYGVLLVCLQLVLSSCGTPYRRDQQSRYPGSMNALEERIREDPGDVAALRDLGLIYYRLKDYGHSKSYLDRAYRLDGSDPATLYYLGSLYESEGDNDSAFAVYAGYARLPSSSPFRSALRSRFESIARNLLEDEIALGSAAVAGAHASRRNGIAVLPLRYTGEDTSFALLGSAMADLLGRDLARATKSQLADRVRSGAFLEAAIQIDTQHVMTGTAAPGIGKILSARQVLWGSYGVAQGGRSLSVEVYAWDIAGKGTREPIRRTGSVEDAGKIEKDIAREILKRVNAGPDVANSQRRIQSEPAASLEGMLLYARSLAREDAGDPESARRFAMRAAEFDPALGSTIGVSAPIAASGRERRGAAASPSRSPSPGPAKPSGRGEKQPGEKESRQKVSQPAGGGGASEESGASRTPAVMTGLPAARMDLINQRLEHLGLWIGSNFIIGDQSRKGAEEAIRLIRLPAPPPPPKRK